VIKLAILLFLYKKANIKPEYHLKKIGVIIISINELWNL